MADQKQITPDNAGVSTQVANPKRASWRTFAQTVVGYFVIVNAAVPLLSGWLSDNSTMASHFLGHYYGTIVAVVNIVGIAVAAISKLVAIVMANPKVDAWIVKYLPALATIAAD